MNGTETEALRLRVEGICRDGVTILLIEHDMRAVFALADRIAVMVYGQIIATGTPDDIRANPRVRAAYLGQESV